MDFAGKERNKRVHFNRPRPGLEILRNWGFLPLLVIAGAATGIFLAPASSQKDKNAAIEKTTDKAISASDNADRQAVSDRKQYPGSLLSSGSALNLPPVYSGSFAVGEGQTPVAYQVAVAGTDGPRLKIIVAR